MDCLSGAGIGWLGALTSASSGDETTTSTMDHSLPTFGMFHHQNMSAGPSPEYLGTLLNVNEALLAQSLANNISAASAPAPIRDLEYPNQQPVLTNMTQSVSLLPHPFVVASSPITPDESAALHPPRTFNPDIAKDDADPNTRLSDKS